LIVVGRFLVYFLAALGIVLLSGRRYFPLDRRMALYLGAVALLMAAGQALWHSRSTYPFVRWDMYGSATPDSTYPAFMIEDGGGAERHYPFTEVAFSAPRAFMQRLDQLVRGCKCAGGDPLVDSVITSLAAIHRDRTGRTITRFDVYDVPIHSAADEPGPRTLRYDWRAAPAGAGAQ
jgi:hypothetical protein